MTDAERRIIEFLQTSGATRPAELPDWLLALLEGDHPAEPSPELITAAVVLYGRRRRPGIGFHAARALFAEAVADPALQEELPGRIAAFRLSCCFERLVRSGRLKAVHIADPFDPDGVVSVELTEASWLTWNATGPRDTPRGPGVIGRN